VLSGLLNLGLCYRELDDHKRAIQVNEQVIEEGVEDLHTEGLAYLRLGIVYDKLHETRKAIDCYKRSLDIQT
jgi:tetratricopeptide (TPR) repeat protein